MFKVFRCNLTTSNELQGRVLQSQSNKTVLTWQLNSSSTQTSRAIWFCMKIEIGSNNHFLPWSAIAFSMTTLWFLVILCYIISNLCDVQSLLKNWEMQEKQILLITTLFDLPDFSDLLVVISEICRVTHPAQFWITGLIGCSSGCSISLWTANKPPIIMSPGELAPTKSSVFWQAEATSELITNGISTKLNNAMLLLHLLTPSFKSIRPAAVPASVPMSSINSSKGKRLSSKVSHTS